jgi:hypothetical protein
MIITNWLSIGEGGAQLRDVGMVQAGQKLDFAEKTRGEFLASGQVGQQDLHGLDAVRNEHSCTRYTRPIPPLPSSLRI